MIIENIEMDTVTTYRDGRYQLFTSFCEKIGLVQTINKYLVKNTGRPFDIPPGILAMIMMAPMADEGGYRPMYELIDFYHDQDLEGIFRYPIELEQLNDDRFAHFLDAFHEAGCRKIFLEICANALLTYNIKIKNINYDTTSWVMWGEYESSTGKTGRIEINFGYSKEKRGDKKQIKFGIGTANGTIVDAKVLSGNEDDKTYNKENIADVSKLLEQMKVDRNDFYYVADSALFSEKNISNMNHAKMKFITRMPDQINTCRTLLDQGAVDGTPVCYINAHNEEVLYYVKDGQTEYDNMPLKYAIVHSTTLQSTKTKTCDKQVATEAVKLERTSKELQTRNFVCEKDAQREIDQMKKNGKLKSKFHDITFTIASSAKKQRGRPFLDESKNTITMVYHVELSFARNENRIKEHIRKECTFILVSNDLDISGKDMLLEYKTQSSVEKRFQQLKNPQFVHALFVKNNNRVEALSYLILLTIMVLSVMEQVVRAGLKKENETVIVTDKRINKQPTFMMIYRVISIVLYQRYVVDGKIYRRLLRPLNDSQQKILRYLQLDETFITLKNRNFP